MPNKYCRIYRPKLIEIQTREAPQKALRRCVLRLAVSAFRLGHGGLEAKLAVPTRQPGEGAGEPMASPYDPLGEGGRGRAKARPYRRFLSG